MTLLLKIDAKGTVAQYWPSIEWSLTQNLLTPKEAADLLTELIVESLEVTEA
jgi:hypothetical protein